MNRAKGPKLAVLLLVTLLGVAQSQNPDANTTPDTSDDVLAPPQVLISSQAKSQSKRRVAFTFEWNQDVAGSTAKSFTGSDVVITSSTGQELKFRKWAAVPSNSKPVANTGYYGEGVAKVDYTSTSAAGTKFVGVVIAPAHGWVEAYVPERAVCSNGLCNGMSSFLRVHIRPSDSTCVKVSTKTLESDSLSIPLTFEFTEAVAANAFKSHHVKAFSYSLNEYLPDVSLKLTPVVGAGLKFYANVDAVNYAQLDLVEIWVEGAKIRKAAGGRFCQSNHLRVKLSSKAFVHASPDSQPQNRQFLPSVLPYGIPGLPYSNPGAILPAPVPPAVATVRSAPSNVATTRNFADEAISSVKLYLNSVQTPNIIDGAVTGVKLSNNAIDTRNLHDNAITLGKIGNNAVDSRALATGSVTDDKLVDFTVTHDWLNDDALDAGSIAAGSIKNAHIKGGGIQLGAVAKNIVDTAAIVGKIDSPDVASATITANKIADGAVTKDKINKFLSEQLSVKVGSDKIGEGAVTASKIAFGAVPLSKLVPGAVEGNNFAKGAVTIDKISNEAVDRNAMGDQSVSNAHIPNSVPQWGNTDVLDKTFQIQKLDPRLISQFGLSSDVVVNDMVVNKQINARNIGEDAVTTIKILDGSVTAADLAHGSVSRDKLIPYGILDADHFATNAGPGSANIANEAVFNSALAENAVTNLAVGEGAVDTVQIEDNAVTSVKMGDNSVSSDHFVDGSVTNDKVGDGTVTTKALADGVVSINKVLPISVLGENLADRVITNEYLADEAVGTKAFASNAITANKILDLSIQKKNIASGAVTSEALADNSVTKAMIQDSAVHGENYGRSSVLQVPDQSVLGRKIADGGIGAGDIVPNAIDRPLVKPGSITNNGFEDDSVTLAKFADASVTAKKVRDLGVDAVEIADQAVTTKKLGPLSVPGFGIADSQITNLHLKNGAVTTRSMDAGAVSAAEIFQVIPQMGSVNLADSSVNTANLGANIVGDAHVASNTVIAANLGSRAVFNQHIAPKSITGRSYGDAAVLESNIRNEAVVTNTKLKDGAAVNKHFSDNSISPQQLANLAVHGAAYASESVSKAHLAAGIQLNERVIGDGGILEAHIVDGSVLTGKIGEKSIQANAFAENSVGADTVVDTSVVSRHFGNKSVTTAKITGVNLIDTAKFADFSLHGRAFADGSISSDKIQDGAATGDAFTTGGIIRDSLNRQVVITEKIKDNGISILESEGTSKIYRGAVSTDHIVDGAVDADALADGAVVAGDIDGEIPYRYYAEGAIKNAAFGAGAVTPGKMVAGLVAGEKFAAGNITSKKLPDTILDDIDRLVEDDTVFEQNFADGAITSAHIIDGAVVQGKIGEGVTTDAIPNNGITPDKIGGFTDYAIKNKTLTGKQFPAGAFVTTAKIADLGVTAGKIPAGAITSDKIKGIGGIKSQPFVEHSMDAKVVDLNGFVVTAEKYMDKGLEAESFIPAIATSAKIAVGGVAGDNFAPGVITTAKMDKGSIDASKLANNSIAAVDLTNGAITGDHLAAFSVTGSKVYPKGLDRRVIIPSGFDTEKLGDNKMGNNVYGQGIFSPELVDWSSQVKAEDYPADFVTEVELKNGGIKTADIADFAITTEKIMIGSINGAQMSNLAYDNFAAGSVTPDKIADGSVGKGPTPEQDGIAFQSNQLDLDYIEDGAVFEASLQENSIGGDSIVDLAIDATRVAEGAAAGDAFEKGAVTPAKMQDNIIQPDYLAANAITSASKFVETAVETGDLALASITGQQIADKSLPWRNTQDKVFQQVSEVNQLIEMVKLTVELIDSRCKTRVAGQSRPMHPMARHGTMRNPGKSMEDHHQYCSRRGLGKAIKVSNNKPHIYKKQLSSASSASASVLAVSSVLVASFLLRLF